MHTEQLPLARAAVDRAAHRRAEHDVLDPAAGPARVVLVRGSELAVLRDDDEVRLDLRPAVELADVDGLRLFLGEDGERLLALVLDDAAVEVDIEGVAAGPLDPAALDWATLREVGHRLGDRDAGLATAAVGLAAWHERHPRCPRCGGPTEPTQGGWVRRCTLDGSDHYPRTDPAVIMAVTDDEDRLLLGHAAHWPERRFSTLAGYVEPGESLEAAVRREVVEETAVVVGEVVYRGSQPWPFPASLMLAFTARALTTAVRVDGVEVTDARWFTRAGLERAVADGEVLLPMRSSVARALIEDWFGGSLPGA
ncbi:NAD(+) diphosphatase [Cellulomonas sp. APG4]|uniref:NAD(+) diphosphatase n=1 Tax=Cellulomonas sp. APG4 TaxID=1538656 RepID=UPI00351B2D32